MYYKAIFVLGKEDELALVKNCVDIRAEEEGVGEISEKVVAIQVQVNVIRRHLIKQKPLALMLGDEMGNFGAVLEACNSACYVAFIDCCGQVRLCCSIRLNLELRSDSLPQSW